jgi:hypothetical protein
LTERAAVIERSPPLCFQTSRINRAYSSLREFFHGSSQQPISREKPFFETFWIWHITKCLDGADNFGGLFLPRHRANHVTQSTKCPVDLTRREIGASDVEWIRLLRDSKHPDD